METDKIKDKAMKLERILADKFLHKDPDESRGKRLLRPSVKLTVSGIALGVSVILLSFFIVEGFKGEIRTKVNGLIGSIVISNPDNVYGQYSIPLELPPDALTAVTETVRRADPEASVYTFADEMALFKTDSAFAGVLMHGVDSLYNRDFFGSYLKAGELPSFRETSSLSDGVLISSYLSHSLSLDVGDEVTAYFRSAGEDKGSDGGIKMRRLRVAGIFDTGFEDFDHKMVVGDIRQVRNLLGLNEKEVSGVMVQLRSSEADTDAVYEQLFALLADRYANNGERYAMNKAEELSNGILDWLNLLDANVLLILSLLTAVAGMTMITGIVVLVMEKVRAIATLKALGQSTRSIKAVFRQMALSILLKGLVWGNLLALVLAGIQYFWHPITLDASQYYMDYVPVQISLRSLLLVNLTVFVVIYLLVLIPVVLISNVRPSEALRFE